MRIDAIALHRAAHWLFNKRVPLLPAVIDGLIFLLFNSTIHHTTRIGSGTVCVYRGMSVLIHKDARIGRNVNIGAHVVIGGRNGSGLPVIQDDVFIAPNAVILGEITIGKGAIIGAGALVLKDVPPFAKALATPAQIVAADA